MWHNSAIVRAGMLVAAAWMAHAAFAQADTSFTEPGERPANPDTSIVLPEPALPGFTDAQTLGADTGDSGDSSDAQIALSGEPAANGVVDGVAVGAIVAPEIPGVEYQTPLTDLFDRGPTGVTGSRDDRAASTIGGGTITATAAVAVPTTPIHPPTISEDPPVHVDLNVDARWPAAARAGGGVMAHSQIIAYYGHPYSKYMGVLGEGSIDTIAEQLKATAAEYDAINGDIGVVPAFHIIYGTVYEDASVGILRESKALEYIEYAKAHGMLVFLDHQIGNGTVDAAIKAMLPFLRYDNVHLAIDPEWATNAPGKEIGSITADDVNRAQQLISDYLRDNHLPGPRILVVHQFNYRMITDRERVRTDYPNVELIHDADGFGPPAHKRDTWRYNVLATNMPLKGFKLFYPKSWRNGGYDIPLMSPEEVMQLDPVPVYIQYQ